MHEDASLLRCGINLFKFLKTTLKYVNLQLLRGQTRIVLRFFFLLLLGLFQLIMLLLLLALMIFLLFLLLNILTERKSDSIRGPFCLCICLSVRSSQLNRHHVSSAFSLRGFHYTLVKTCFQFQFFGKNPFYLIL